MDESNTDPTTRVTTPAPDEAPAAPAATTETPAPAETTFGGPPPAAPAAPTTPAGSWAAPQRRDRRDGGRVWSLIFGLFILGLGVWFFLDSTLGYDMPNIRWSQFWPVILIVIGAVVLLGALRRERR
jgi:uncharacterized membrane protein